MIDGKTLLVKKFGRKIVEQQTKDRYKHVCEACSTQCSEERPHSKCNFAVIDKDSMLKKLFIYSNVSIPKEDAEDISILFDIGIYRHNISLYDMYLMDISYKVCGNCNGTGVSVKHDSIDECIECGGTGLIKREHENEVIIDFCENEFGHSHCNYYTDETTAQRAYTILKESNDHYVHKVVYVNKKYLGYKENYYSVLDRNKKFVVVDTHTNRIEVSGNYFEIHDKIGLPYYMDIEYLSNNRYMVYEEEEFWGSHEVVLSDTSVVLPDDVYDKMRSEIITTGLLLYTGNATYNCTELVEKYTEKYSTVDMIIDNVEYHIDETENSVVAGDKLTYLNKIIADGKLIGMNLSQLQAAKIMESIISMTGEQFYPTLLTYNVIIIFIVEFICISAEYASLTDE